jgi:glutathione S-transferase
MNYLTVAEAETLPGLRVAFTRGMPGPWGLGARAILELKGIPFHAVEQVPGGDNDALRRWTGQNSAPCAMFNDERPRAHWSEIILLAERLSPEPRLVPENEDERVLMFGICHELCGEHGLGWSIRLILLAAQEARGAERYSSLAIKYGSGTPIDFSARRFNEIITMLARRLETQKAKGSDFLIGNAVSAADIYWTAFSNMLVAMAPDACVNPDFYMELGPVMETYLDAPLPLSLIDHRERILRDYFTKPIAF